MYVVRNIERTCCTCNHWMGTRVVEGDGFVYSLKSIEGICREMRRAKITEGLGIVTLPAALCSAWERWHEIELAVLKNLLHAATPETGDTTPPGVPTTLPIHPAVMLSEQRRGKQSAW